ncbi:MAG TPA: hypothetical protein DET40_22700 [Lentisphaeria bacterium]|nr:MAG: hypothetical protein A2X45_23170 [Lentisphaerae bacterium GWF2_50_93]HCE46365.1 hypothetical protein [Lentisphaeria bacterium]
MKKHGQEKEDIIEEAYEEITTFEDSFVKNWSTILNIAIGVVIIFAVYLTYTNYSQKKEVATVAEFNKAKTVPELQAVIAAHPENPSANFAKIRMMKLLVDEKKYEEALKACREIRQVPENPETFWQSKLNEGYILELMNKKEDAAEALSKISTDIKFPAGVRSEASYSAGRIFLAVGKNDRAVASLKTAVDASAGAEDFWADQAKTLMMNMN